MTEEQNDIVQRIRSELVKVSKEMAFDAIDDRIDMFRTLVDMGIVSRDEAYQSLLEYVTAMEPSNDKFNSLMAILVDYESKDSNNKQNEEV